MNEPEMIRVELRRKPLGGLEYFFDSDLTPIPQEWELVFAAQIDVAKLRKSEHPEEHVADVLRLAFADGVERGRNNLNID